MIDSSSASWSREGGWIVLASVVSVMLGAYLHRLSVRGLLDKLEAIQDRHGRLLRVLSEKSGISVKEQLDIERAER